MTKKKLMGASIGNCVHVAGVIHFLAIAEEEGYETKFLGPAVPLERLYENIIKYQPDMIGVSYRLTPQNGERLLKELYEWQKKLNYKPVWVFGGTRPVAQIARKLNLFSFVSDGTDDIIDSIRFLRGGRHSNLSQEYPQTLVERITNSYPYPILRHHFGLPSMDDTALGIEEIAKAQILDVISIGPDQNAQQYFFQKNKMKKEYDGAGGVPIRTPDDLIRLKMASQCGNYPLMRCYSGTEDVLKYGELLKDTIDNAWAAIPLCWYNEIDGRGSRSIEKSVIDAFKLISWHARCGIPVEINEPHHWALRDAHDVMSVVMAYISAYTAKKLGVKDYIAQYMFNVPNGLSFSMDLARVLAMIEIVESLQSLNFKIYRETRAGLPLFAADEDIAKGQLAASTFMQMCVQPHILHVVAYCEADHAASAYEVISSCKIVKGVIRHTLNDSYSMEKDEKIFTRKEELIREAKVLINFLVENYSDYKDPLANPEVIAKAVRAGYLDAVHILKNQKYRGNLYTKLVDGKCVACDKETGKILTEDERISRLKDVNGNRE